MTTIQRRPFLRGLAALGLGAVSGQAASQSTASPLRIILPFSAGSGVDTTIRAIQPALIQALGGQPVVMENIAGAGGISGTQAIVRAKADGNTIGVVSNNHAVNPSVYKRMPYDAIADITPISVLGSTPFLFVVNPARIAARTAQELQALLKSKPGVFNYASSGNGTIIHLAGEMAIDALGAQVRHIPYKGVAQQITDLIAGHVEMGVVSAPAGLAHVRSGALRAIGVMGRQRLDSLPDLRTFAEQGFDEVDVAGWFAAVGPAGIPAVQVARIHEAFVKAFQNPEVKLIMQKQENQIHPGTPAEALAFMRSEQVRFGRLAAKADIRLD